jgi:epoxyqueuosine reductase
MPLESEIKAEAIKLGFVVCGITTPAQPETFGAFQSWIEAGCHAGMDYLARPGSLSARENPASLLPGCRSVICVGLSYPPPEQPAPASRSGLGLIAAYALLPDYHHVVQAGLEKLAARLPGLAGRSVQSKVCVDTSPILEKDLARRAGLGWIGRNSLLYAPRLGSYLFLGELLTDLELLPDASLQGDPCQDCRRCVDACPTQALRPDRSVDARRCLSYLTIEHRGSIQSDLRPLLGWRVFGCDTCQAVCPLNQAAPTSASALPVISAHPDLLEELALSQAAWKAKSQGPPVLRAGYAGYRRNLAVALANLRPEGAFQALQAALEEELSPDLRDTFRWALEQLQAPDVKTKS